MWRDMRPTMLAMLAIAMLAANRNAVAIPVVDQQAAASAADDTTQGNSGQDKSQVEVLSGAKSSDATNNDELSKWDVTHLFKALMTSDGRTPFAKSPQGTMATAKATGKTNLVMDHSDERSATTGLTMPERTTATSLLPDMSVIDTMRELDRAERDKIVDKAITSLGKPQGPTAENTVDPALVWYGPAASKSGFAAEARYYATSLSKLLRNFYVRQFGDVRDDVVLETLPLEEMVSVMNLMSRPETTGSVVSVCHSVPTQWFGNAPEGWGDEQCPPPNAVFRIGRAMFETDGMPPGWADQCNKMDEIWVPSKWNADTFARAGVDKDKLFVVPEPVDTEEKFNPENVATPYPLPVPPHTDSNLPAMAQLMQIFAQTNAAAKTAVTTAASAGATASAEATPKTVFKFLSIFKWHKRKGVDVLLRAYCEEFRADEPVALYIKSGFYMSNPEEALEQQLRSISQSLNVEGNDLPRIKLLSEWIPDTRLPALYKAADAFVLPSRGEGWGLPVAEAMSMGLPAIATDWSGTTEFLNKDVGLPIKYTLRELSPDDMDDMYIGAQLDGHKYAEPSVEDLRKQMRWVYDNRVEAKKLGAAAREHMRHNFSPSVVAKIITDRVQKVAPQLGIH